MRRNIWTLFGAVVITSGCGLGAFHGGTIGGGGPVSTPIANTSVDVIACDTAADPCARRIAGARIGLHTLTCPGDECYLWQTADAQGYVVFTVLSTLGTVDTVIRADGYNEKRAPIDVQATHDGRGHNYIAVLPVPPPHVDPSSIPLGQLAAIRGAMWPSASRCPGGLNLPFGPRPNQPDNIIATDFFSQYSAADQKAIVECLKAQGYTHVVMGPLVDSDGYHGTYRPRDWRGAAFEEFLDVAQTFWDAGLAPVVFIHPDGWTFERTRDELTPLLRQPRAQKLIRIVIPAGWEPAGYEWSSCTWLEFFRWARSELPNALVLWHNAVKADGSPYDAPVGTDARCDDNGKPNAEGWARVAPYLHGLLLQFGPFDGVPDLNTQLGRDFAGQFDQGRLGADAHGFAWHFTTPATGWPQGSAWGPSTPVLIYLGEVTAYQGFWKNMPESQRVAWGDFAMAHGAGGYLDGGSAAVPVRR